MKEDMRGVLFIVKGQYRKDKGVKFFNEVSNTYHHIGGYDPSDSSNPEWYMLVENLTFHTLASGSDLEKVVRCARLYIEKYPTQVRFRKMLDRLESKDSPVTKRIMEEVYKEYGDTYSDLIDGVVTTTYEEVREANINRLYKRAKKTMRRLTKSYVSTEVKRPAEKVTPSVATPHKRKKLPVKRLKM